MKHVHFCISIDGVLRHTDSKLKRDHCTWITRDDGSRMTPTELRVLFCEYKARGFDAIPTCDYYDERGHCRGHNDEQPKQSVDVRVRFNCPLCGSYKWGTSNATAPFDEWIGHCHGDSGCQFSWPRTDDGKYFRHPVTP